MTQISQQPLSLTTVSPGYPQPKVMALALGNNEITSPQQTQVKPLGSYRNDLSYTAALKSAQPLALGNYRHDIQYAAALKSTQQPTAHQTTAFGVDAKSLNTSHVHFAGANTSLLTPVLFSAPVIGTFAALSQANAMFALAARDLLDSSGRIYQEFKRNRHGGRESFIEELGTSVIWGFGIPSIKSLYDRVIANAGVKGNSNNIQFPSLDLSLIKKMPGEQVEKKDTWLSRFFARFSAEEQHPAQVLDAQSIEKYFKNFKNLPDSQFNKQKQQLLDLASGKGPAAKLMGKYRGNQFIKLLLCTGLPVLGIGIGIPILNQALTRQRVRQEQASQGWWIGSTHNTAPTPLTHQSRILRMSSQPQGVYLPPPDGGVQTQKIASPFTMPAKQPAVATVKFGSSLLQRSSDVVGSFLQNDKWTSLAFVDTPLSGGRVVTARNKDERIERLFRESCMIAVLFFVQTWLQDKIAAGFDKFLDTASNVSFKTLKRLHKSYGDMPDPDQAFLKDYKQLSQEQLNGKSIRQWLGESSDLETRAKRIDEIRQYFSTHQTGVAKPQNFFLDLATISDDIPTIAGPNGERGFIKITQKINEGGLETLASYLDQIAYKLQSQPAGSIQKMVSQTTKVKMAAFTLSAALCWGLVSFIVPKAMHGITKLRTGKDEFPGINGLV